MRGDQLIARRLDPIIYLNPETIWEMRKNYEEWLPARL